MRKSAKRFLSTILALTMLCSCMAATNAVSAFAATAAGTTVSIDTTYSVDLTAATAYTDTDGVDASYSADSSSATLTGVFGGKSYADIVIDENGNSIVSGTITISGKFQATNNSNWQLISLVNSNGKAITGIRADGDSTDEGGNTITDYVLGTSNIAGGAVDTGVAYDNSEHDYVLTVDLDKSTVSLQLDEADVVTNTIADSSEIYGIQLYVSSSTSRYVKLTTPTVAYKGDVDFVYFDVTEEEAETYSYFTITKSGSDISDLTDQTTVYTALDFDGDGTADYTPSSGYVVGYKVKGATDTSDFGTTFGMTLSETAASASEE